MGLPPPPIMYLGNVLKIDLPDFNVIFSENLEIKSYHSFW